MVSEKRIESEIVAVSLGCVPEPPVDLSQLAKNIHVGDIRPTNFRHGFTDFRSTVPTIYLNNVQLKPSIRLTFAYELAHVILRMPGVMYLIQARGRTHLLTDEEALAESIAATILVPDNLIEKLRDTRMPLKSLEHIAHFANVSVMTLVARMASSGIDIALLHWQKGNGAWHVIDRPGSSSCLHGYIKPSAIGYSAIERLSREESDVVVDCRINNKYAKIGGRGYRYGQQAFHLLEPSVDIWIACEE